MRVRKHVRKIIRRGNDVEAVLGLFLGIL